MEGVPLLEHLNELALRYGVGRIDRSRTAWSA